MYRGKCQLCGKDLLVNLQFYKYDIVPPPYLILPCQHADLGRFEPVTEVKLGITIA
jgi:hypothetical protein